MEFFKTYALLVTVLQAKNSVLKFDFPGVTLCSFLQIYTKFVNTGKLKVNTSFGHHF